MLGYAGNEVAAQTTVCELTEYGGKPVATRSSPRKRTWWPCSTPTEGRHCFTAMFETGTRYAFAVRTDLIDLEVPD
jgi:hypothetical protein